MNVTENNDTAVPLPSGQLGPEFTKYVVASMGQNTDPRLREVMSSFIRHVHEFAREVDLTFDEWMLGINLITWAGQMSTEKRNDLVILSDIIGLESLVDDITARKLGKVPENATTNAVLGPFWRPDTPLRDFGSTIAFDVPSDAQVAFVHGTVKDAVTGAPLKGAMVDVWEASTNGLYEQQDPEQREHNLRGKFLTNDEGQYAFYGLRPTPYPVPGDGPSAHVLGLLDRPLFRPAHIHFVVSVKGYKSLTTQIYDSESKYLDQDPVFAVKDELLLKFFPRKGDQKAEWEAHFDLALTRDSKEATANL